MSKTKPAEDVLELLYEGLQINLGRLHGAEEVAILQSLSELGSDNRTMLHALEVLERRLTEHTFYMTPLGRDVAGACYHRWSKLIEFDARQLERTRLRRQIAGFLPEELRRSLALMSGAEIEVIETTIILMPREDRLTLVAFGVIEDNLDGSPDDPVEVTLTDAGRLIIDECRFMELPLDQQEKIGKLECAAREYYSKHPS